MKLQALVFLRNVLFIKIANDLQYKLHYKLHHRLVYQ